MRCFRTLTNIRHSAVALITLALIAAVEPGSSAAQPASQSTAAAIPRTRVVVLGEQAGRTAWRGRGEGGFSAAVQVGKDVYVVDFGAGWQEAFFRAGLATPGNPSRPSGMETMRAGFITHLHADHVADYARLIQFGPTDGLQLRKTPVEIFGPGRVADGARMFPGIKDAKALMRPDNPAPGIRDLTESLLEAFATDINDNMSDGGKPSPRQYLKVSDIDIPADAGASPSHPSPRMSPFEIYKDENVRVFATLVNHAPMFPAFGFRFETPDGVIVFSGDTNRNENLIELAKGADVLVHEVIDMNWPRQYLPEPRSVADEAKLRHLLEAHADIAEVGSIAEQAGARILIISHFSPPTTSDAGYLSQVKGFSGKTIVGRRLVSVSLPLR